jgi:hypothetical protein
MIKHKAKLACVKKHYYSKPTNNGSSNFTYSTEITFVIQQTILKVVNIVEM